MSVVHQSCTGYVNEPFSTLVANYPGDDVYPADDFRVEWGPIFHRGRLDGTARVLVLGQDPATHETISRRILVGEAGQRLQGLLAKVGISESYVMLNVYLYSLYGQGGGTRQLKNVGIADYRNAWLDALLVASDITAVVTLGDLATTAYTAWSTRRPAAASGIHLISIRHPTYAEGAARGSGRPLAETTAEQLANWNDHLPALAAHLEPESAVDLTPYGTAWAPSDLSPISERDLPPGTPDWWRDVAAWAVRSGADAQQKRATITVSVPKGARTWPPQQK
ncbi:MAG: uracil-DNA glycosylase family protein [Terracoccus sp.]